MIRKDKEAEESTGFVGFMVQYWRQLTRYMVTGMLVWVPLLITVWVSWFFIQKFVLGVEYLIQDIILKFNVWGSKYPLLRWLEHIRYYFGMGALVVVALFLTTGFLTRFIVGRRIIELGERIVSQIPLISRIYRAVQQIRDTFIGRKGAVFQSVCLVEYPRAGMLAVAFVTSAEQGIIQQIAGRKLHAVFVPTTPNPTSGYLIYLPPEDIALIDISVEEAMKLIVSGGAYLPGELKIQPQGMKNAAKQVAQRTAAMQKNTPQDETL
jgi:uncharacterized membrane protein